MSLFNEATKRSETIGQFQAHPLGRFAAVFVGVKAGEWDGMRFYELMLRSKEDDAKQTVWENLEAHVQGRLLQKMGGDVEKAKKAYVDAVARAMYLYRITGLPLPQNETQLYSGLGQLVGKQVTMEVKNNPKDARHPYINLYPISELEGRATSAATATEPGGASDWTGAAGHQAPPLGQGNPPDLSDVPF